MVEMPWLDCLSVSRSGSFLWFEQLRLLIGRVCRWLGMPWLDYLSVSWPSSFIWFEQSRLLVRKTNDGRWVNELVELIDLSQREIVCWLRMCQNRVRIDELRRLFIKFQRPRLWLECP